MMNLRIKLKNKKTVMILGLGIFLVISFLVWWLTLPAQARKPVQDWNYSQNGSKIFYLAKETAQENSLRVIDLLLKTDKKLNLPIFPRQVFWRPNSDQALVLAHLKNETSDYPWLVDFNKETVEIIPVWDFGVPMDWSDDDKSFIYTVVYPDKIHYNFKVFDFEKKESPTKYLLGQPLKNVAGIQFVNNGEKYLITQIHPEIPFQQNHSLYDPLTGNLEEIVATSENYLAPKVFKNRAIFLSRNGITLFNLETKERVNLASTVSIPYLIDCVWIDENNLIYKEVDSEKKISRIVLLNPNTFAQKEIVELGFENEKIPLTTILKYSTKKGQVSTINKQQKIILFPLGETF